MFLRHELANNEKDWCAIVDKPARGKKLLKHINTTIKDYDADKQWEVLVCTVEHEREVAAMNASGGKWYDMFKGRDLVGHHSFLIYKGR